MYNVNIREGDELPQDVWAVVFPSIMQFVWRDGAPYGRNQAIEYPWGDERLGGIDITIEVWRDSAGINARRKPNALENQKPG